MFKNVGIFIFALHVAVALFLELIIFLKKEKHTENINRGNSLLTYYKYFLLAMLCFFSAFGIWILDFKKIVCDPDNHILQGHAIWHVLTAFCYLFLFRFYSTMSIDFANTEAEISFCTDCRKTN